MRLAGSLPEVAADAGLLERVLANLVANALRFSRPDQPPVLAARATPLRLTRNCRRDADIQQG